MATMLSEDNFKCIFFNENDRIPTQISLRFIARSPIDNKQHWFRWWLGAEQATSHCLSQCWPRSLSPYGVTRPQWVNQQSSTRVNSLAPERCGSNFTSVVFKCILHMDILSTSCDIGHSWVPQSPTDDNSTLNTTTPHWSLVNIGSGNDLVPSGNKPLPKPMLSQISVTISRH